MGAQMTRSRYLKLGVSLMALKYAGDFFLVGLAAGRIWTPPDYLGSLVFAVSPKLDDAPTWLLWAMGLWVLPFVLVGVRLTMRRAIDAGWTPWIALCFFVPVGNYALMAALCLAPSIAPTLPIVEGRMLPQVGRRTAFVIAAIGGALLGPLMIGLTVYLLGTYGTAMFLGTPFAMGAVSGYLLARLEPDIDQSDAAMAGLLAIVVVAAAVLAFAIEGLVCLIMAVPLSVPLATFGAAMGLSIARRSRGDMRPMMFGLLALPLAAVMEPAVGAPQVAREVFSSIEIAAAPEAVWPRVVAFQPMTEPTDWLSRSGIAYPRSARIDGAGVGAVRYCEFSTGAFVEPITAWEPGRRLAFDVSASPPPLRELSVYANVRAPHLDGFLQSRRGEFRMVALPGGRTRLEGRTWYEIDMAPEWYWRLYGDWMIHRIHERVLDHIRSEIEHPRARQ